MKYLAKGFAVGMLLAAPLSMAGSGSTADHIKAATDGYKQVSKDTGYQWTVTVVKIKEAQKALDAGDDKSARKLAHEAMDLVEATRQQAKIEADTWKMRVPK